MEGEERKKEWVVFFERRVGPILFRGGGGEWGRETAAGVPPVSALTVALAVNELDRTETLYL